MSLLASYSSEQHIAVRKEYRASYYVYLCNIFLQVEIRKLFQKKFTIFDHRNMTFHRSIAMNIVRMLSRLKPTLLSQSRRCLKFPNYNALVEVSN